MNMNNNNKTKPKRRIDSSKVWRILLCAAFFTLHSLLFTSCNDWLDVLPNNEQVTDDYWKSKEDVEAVIASGYYYMRQCVPTYI